MTEKTETIIIVFHSFPRKPCLDGLMSAILSIKFFQRETTKLQLIPYWRTNECFLKIKNAVEDVTTPQCRIVYVDCSPDLPEEVDYLSKILPRIPITVYDHHRLKADSPINNIIEKTNFTFNFDSDNCASNMIYKLLSVESKDELGVGEILTIIQFSEYEGMNSTLSEKTKAQEISIEALENAKNFFTEPKIKEGINKILDMDMGLFYVLDQILAGENEWKFLTDPIFSRDQVYQKFIEQTAIYLTSSKNVLAGREIEVFSVDHIDEYIKTLDSLPDVFSSGTILKNQQINGGKCDVFAIELSIFDYGRCLEPMVVAEMRRRSASYAILMNKPSKTAAVGLSYYFSLRRVDDRHDARQLAKYIMEFTGTIIGGGHPWASGVTLNEEQYKKFKTLFNQ